MSPSASIFASSFVLTTLFITRRAHAALAAAHATWPSFEAYHADIAKAKAYAAAYPLKDDGGHDGGGGGGGGQGAGATLPKLKCFDLPLNDDEVTKIIITITTIITIITITIAITITAITTTIIIRRFRQLYGSEVGQTSSCPRPRLS